MIEDVIRRIAPSQIDPQMLLMTEFCLGILTSLFLFFSAWIILPVIMRWIQFRAACLKANSIRKQYKDLRSTRNHLRSKLFVRTRWAREPYEAFHKAWEEARPHGEDKALIPLRLREFLTPEIVLDGARNRRLAEALPGIFVALGIFGTFLGLVLGLRELEFGKLESLQQGVGHLISGLSLAFLTSLGGIAFSILFSLAYRLLINWLERSCLSLDDLIATVYPYDSHERYARRHYDLQTDIKQGLQTLATDVATQLSGAIGSKLGEALEEHLVPVMKDFQTFMAEHIEESKQQQSTAMEAVLEHYSTTLAQTFQNQFEAMGAIIVQTTDAQKEIKQQLVEFGNQMKTQFESQSELIEKTNRASAALAQSLESLETIAHKLNITVEGISNAATLLENSAAAAKEGQDVLRETMERQIENMSRTREELETTWTAVTENARLLVERIHESIQELSTIVGGNLVKALESFDGKVAEVVERFSGTLFETSQTINEIPTLVLNMNENLNAIGSAIQEQKGIVDGMKETADTVIQGNLNIAVEVSENFYKSTNQISASTESLRQSFDAFSEYITDNAHSFNDNARQIVSELKRIVDDLAVQMKPLMEIGDRTNAEETTMTAENANTYNGSRDSQLYSELTDAVKGLSNLITESKNAPLTKSTDGDETEPGAEKIMAGIENQINLLSRLLKAILHRMDAITSVATKMTKAIESEDLQQSDAANSYSNEKKWWQFGKGSKK